MNSDQTTPQISAENNLFPVFIKLEQLRLLIIGGGNVGLEKLNAVLQNSPATKIRLVATAISAKIKERARDYAGVELFERPYTVEDLDQADIVIVAINDKASSRVIGVEAKARGKLINVADTPDLCDFYLGSIVKKGNLKIAISTNGKSPTVAKRLREQLNELIPDEIEGVLENMHSIRQDLKGDFAEKVKQLDDLTKVLSAKQTRLDQINKPGGRKWQGIVKWCLFAFFFMLFGHLILSYIPFRKISEGIHSLPQYIDVPSFLMMTFTGFLAQMVDGSLGMGYGTISTTFLLANGVSPAIVSSRVHSARVFSSGVSGYSHHRFGNINKKLFRALIIPGVIGAVTGATLAYFGQKYTTWVRVPLSIYTLYLGYYIIRKAFRKKNKQNKVKNVGWLASAGGFMDAFAGGGWGSLVTGTLISKRRNPRYVIGSVCLAEFFVVFASSITFFILLKTIFFVDVAGLIIGGLIAAPIAARLVGKIPMKIMFMAVGSLVIATSILTLIKVVSKVLMHG
ncbi:MAG: TSUP family transporter [Bacteroidota bacterium]|nr:TSUP family transporter [Bacteroidota bacterium]MDP4213357.1 TSUP family transporter [Bacteroidota bacterium]